MVLPVSTSIYAGKCVDTQNEPLYNQSEYDMVMHLFESLPDDAKDDFIYILSKDSVYSDYVNTIAQIYACDVVLVDIYSINTSLLDALYSELSALNLPNEVRLCFEALGSAISAAIADGPLVAGDIYLLAVSLALVTTLVIYWDDVQLLWDDIVDCFNSTYNLSQVQSDDFIYIENDTISEYTLYKYGYYGVSVDYASTTVKVNGVSYPCTESVDYITDKIISKLNDNFYYICFLVRESSEYVMYYCPTPVSRAIAKSVIAMNNQRIVIMAHDKNFAQSIASPIYEYHPYCSHTGEEGYYPHFHPKQAQSVHVWYYYE